MVQGQAKTKTVSLQYSRVDVPSASGNVLPLEQRAEFLSNLPVTWYATPPIPSKGKKDGEWTLYLRDPNDSENQGDAFTFVGVDPLEW
ncbi:MAG: hypothetical protein ACPGO3_04570 [Magnetospiraceae bacterium]